MAEPLAIRPALPRQRDPDDRVRIAELPADALLKPKEAAVWLGVHVRQLGRLGVPVVDLTSPARVRAPKAKEPKTDRLNPKTKRYIKRDLMAWIEQQRRTA